MSVVIPSAHAHHRRPPEGLQDDLLVESGRGEVDALAAPPPQKPFNGVEIVENGPTHREVDPVPPAASAAGLSDAEVAGSQTSVLRTGEVAEFAGPVETGIEERAGEHL